MVFSYGGLDSDRMDILNITLAFKGAIILLFLKIKMDFVRIMELTSIDWY